MTEKVENLGNPTLAESSNEVQKKVSREPIWLPGDVHSNLGFQKGKT